jgi:alpha-galactosidase
VTFIPIDEVEVDPDTARVYIEGWQSWSPTGWYSVDGSGPRPDEPWQHRMRFRPGTELPAEGYQGEGLLAVNPGGGHPVRVYGVDDPCERVPSIRAHLVGSTVLVSADGPLSTRIASAGGDAALAAFADHWLGAPGEVPIRPAPTVWCSWYHYFEDVTEADITENLVGIRQESLPVDVIRRIGESVDNLAGLKVSESPFERVEPYLDLGLPVLVGAGVYLGLGATFQPISNRKGGCSACK